MPLTRTPTWDTVEFPRFIAAEADSPFLWGTNDCCLFAANAIKAMTGTDIADDFLGLYDSEETAFALITKITGGSCVADAVAYCAAKHGLTEWLYPLQAQRGDLVVIDNGSQLIAGVVHPNGIHVVTVSESGLRRLPMNSVKRAWKV